MKLKKILSLLLVIAMLLGVAITAVSCGPDDPEEPEDNPGDNPGGNPGGNPPAETGEDYTVTLVDIFGAPVANIQLKFTYGSNESATLTTGADGKATAKIDTTETVYVEFVTLGEYGDLHKNSRKFASNSNELTITMLQGITVKILDENGNGVAGVRVVVCHDGGCVPFREATNENGETNQGLDANGTLKASVSSVPAGYAIPEAIGESEGVAIHAYFDTGSYTVTIVIPFAN